VNKNKAKENNFVHNQGRNVKHVVNDNTANGGDSSFKLYTTITQMEQ